MIPDRFSELITYLASRNGTFEEELTAKVNNGELTSEEALYVGIYVKMRKMADELTKLQEKATTLL